MSTWKSCLHWLSVVGRSLRHRALARPLDRASDAEIDAALGRAKLTRGDLFQVPNAMPWYRVYMAHMLKAHLIDPVLATEKRWEDIKLADGRCAQCTSRRRCRTWLEQICYDGAPIVFCSNAPVFEAIAAEQRTESR